MTANAVETQLALEQAFLRESNRRTLMSEAKLQHKASPRNDLTATGAALVSQATAELAEGLNGFFSRSVATPNAEEKWLKATWKKDTWTLAYLCVSSTIAIIHTIPNEISVRCKIASAVIKEHEARLFQAHNPGYYESLMARVRKSPSGREKARILSTGFRKADMDVKAYADYMPPDRYSMGHLLMMLMLKCLPWLFTFERIYVPGRKHKRKVLCLTARVEDWKDSYIEAIAKASVVFQPMVCPPVPYKSDGTGGYLSFPDYPVKTGRRGRKHTAEKINWESGVWLKGLEAIQATPWEVDQLCLTTMQVLIRCNHSALPTYDIPEPPYPGDIDKNSNEWAHYRQLCRARHDKQHKMAGRRIGLLAASDTALKVFRHRPIYMPQQCDFRGRLYSQSTALGPQGADYAKGLLRFHKKKPLGDRGAYWLAVHIANLCGVDKVSFDERVKWVHDHSDVICEWATNPQSHMGWLEQDKPWQALLAAQDWLGYDKYGPAFESSIPVAMDGSNNGLQHLSAILRDKVGAHYVNMLPVEEPQDVYAFIAGKLTEWLQEQKQRGGLWSVNKGTDREAHFNVAHMAKVMLDNIGISRKLLKRPTMTYAYNATAHSMGQYMRTDEGCISDKVAAGADLEGFSEYLLGIWLGQPTYKIISGNLKGAGTVMDWLSKASLAIAKAGYSTIEFDTPSGFHFCQDMRYNKLQRVKLCLAGKHTFFTRPGEESVSGTKARTSFAPNMVHAMDASHMLVTAEHIESRVKDVSFAMVHDSYGVHACDVDELHVAIRESFRDMYANWCPMSMLAEAYPDVDFPEVPSKGTYDINQVLSAPYFFS